MPEMFDEHPGHLELRPNRGGVTTCRIALCSFLFALTSVSDRRHYFVGDGFAGTAFDGEGFAEADADGDGAAIGGVTGVP